MVSLRNMTEEEFGAFLTRITQEYAQEKVKAGSWTAAEALQRSKKEHDDLLPHGLSSQHQHLYTIVADGEPAGQLWLSTEPKFGQDTGFIYELFVAEPFRRKGVATQAMLLLETLALRLGVKTLALHVFGHNTGAKALYDELGYRITDINMAKPLSGS